MKKKENDYRHPNEVSAKKQGVLSLIGLAIGLLVVYICFDVIGIGDSLIPKRDNSTVLSIEQIESAVGFGEYDGSTYSNSFCGLSFELPDESWTFKTPEEIARIQSGDVNDNERAFVETESQICYYDMFAFDEISGSSVVLGMETGKTENYADKSTSDMYLQSVCDTVLEGDSSADISDVYGITVGDATYRAIDISYSLNIGGAVQTVAVKKAGNGYIILTVTRYSDMDDTSNKDYLDLFSAY